MLSAITCLSLDKSLGDTLYKSRNTCIIQIKTYNQELIIVIQKKNQREGEKKLDGKLAGTNETGTDVAG